MAIWLSKEKANLANLEKKDNIAEVLLFKQAIALGWDCPRAAVLLIFRKMQSDTFTIQTVGRILRMPEQRFYTDNALNVGYVYTDISKDKIQIVAEDMDYLNKDMLQATRREELENIVLTSYYSERKSSDRNRLGMDFKQILAETFKENWGLTYRLMTINFEFETVDETPTTDEADLTDYDMAAAKNRKAVADRINFDVKNINVEIPADVTFQNEIGFIDLGERKKFTRSAGEVSRIFTDYCRGLLGGDFETSHSTGVLVNYLQEVMEELFGLFLTDAEKVILYYSNKPKFTDIIQKALRRYAQIVVNRKRDSKLRSYRQYDWEVPAERLYKEQTHRVMERVRDHALRPFIELTTASTPEQRFRDFLESNADAIDWWYKNGDEGKQHYSVPYVTMTGDSALFYVDFIVRMKNGQVFLFDTKTEMSDPNAPQKHNALLEYMRQLGNEAQHLKGGVIIEHNEVWYYSSMPITTTSDVTGWDAFFPDEYKQ